MKQAAADALAAAREATERKPTKGKIRLFKAAVLRSAAAPSTEPDDGIAYSIADDATRDQLTARPGEPFGATERCSEEELVPDSRRQRRRRFSCWAK